jgi:hypothetical protein
MNHTTMTDRSDVDDEVQGYFTLIEFSPQVPQVAERSIIAVLTPVVALPMPGALVCRKAGKDQQEY